MKAIVKHRLQFLESEPDNQAQRPGRFEKSEPSTANLWHQNLITANFRTVVHGVEVTFTLQDEEEATLLTRLDLLLAHVQVRQRYSRAWENQIERARTLFHQR